LATSRARTRTAVLVARRWSTSQGRPGSCSFHFLLSHFHRYTPTIRGSVRPPDDRFPQQTRLCADLLRSRGAKRHATALLGHGVAGSGTSRHKDMVQKRGAAGGRRRYPQGRWQTAVRVLRWATRRLSKFSLSTKQTPTDILGPSDYTSTPTGGSPRPHCKLAVQAGKWLLSRCCGCWNGHSRGRERHSTP